MSIDVAVVGASGRIARTKHLPALNNLQAMGRIRRICVVSRDLDSLKSLHRDFPSVIPMTYEQVLADSDIRIVLDASGPKSRLDVVRAALEVGKHVLTEKPLGLTSHESQELYDRATKAGVVASMVQDKLFTPGYQALASVLKEEKLGTITNITGEFGYWVDTGVDESRPMQRPSWNYQTSQGGDIVSDLFTHWTYMLRMVDDIDFVSAVSATYFDKRRNEYGKLFDSDVPDTLFVTGKCKSGILFDIRNSWVMRPFTPFTLVVNGEIATTRTTPQKCEIFRSSGAVGETPEEALTHHREDEFLVLWQHFLDKVILGVPDVSGFRTGLLAEFVCDAINESLSRNSIQIPVGDTHG